MCYVKKNVYFPFNSNIKGYFSIQLSIVCSKILGKYFTFQSLFIIQWVNIMVNKNMSAEDYIDYLYDDNEDFFTNIDYTLPESYAYLDAKIPYKGGQKVD